jgi:O-antigen ligase
MLLVLPLGLSDGGYFGRSYTTLTLAFGAIAGLAVVRRTDIRLPVAFVATATALALLGCWVALSSVWAVEGAGVELEVRRCVLYAVALVGVGAVAGLRQRALLLALAAAIFALAVVGACMRAISGLPVDPYYGSLLAEPVGYPNAMGVLAAIGVVLAIGLGPGAGVVGARALRAVAPFLVLVLGLTGSRGGALALGLGLLALVLLSEKPARWGHVGGAASACVVGGGAWWITVTTGGDGLPLVLAAACAGVIGGFAPPPGRRATGILVGCLALAAAAVVVVEPPSTTSSLRSAYWGAALAEVRERPLLGSGAGSFYLTWREHRTVQTDVRDAHSLYVESLSELGPLGLALVVLTVGAPVAAAVRRRGDPLAAAAGAGFAVFAVHAALDWDWEMPVVTLVALGCAGAVLTRETNRTREERS